MWRTVKRTYSFVHVERCARNDAEYSVILCILYSLPLSCRQPRLCKLQFMNIQSCSPMYPIMLSRSGPVLRQVTAIYIHIKICICVFLKPEFPFFSKQITPKRNCNYFALTVLVMALQINTHKKS
jgi:hypothetical protein